MQDVFFDGIERIVKTLQMNIHTPNPHTKKDENTSHTQPNKPKLLTKPAKVSTWTKDITLETYTKQIQTWSDVLEEISEHVKYADLVESLNTNKEIKGLQNYFGEHILPVLEVKEEQTLKRVLEILSLKYGRTRVKIQS